MNTSYIRVNWRKISTALLALTALSLGGMKAYAYAANDDCCAPGAPCCHPGSPCCNHGKTAQR